MGATVEPGPATPGQGLLPGGSEVKSRAGGQRACRLGFNRFEDWGFEGK